MPEKIYTKRPDQVRAIPAHEVIDAAMHAWDDLPQWIRDAYDAEKISFEPDRVKIQNALSGDATGTDLVVNRGDTMPIVAMTEADFNTAYVVAPDVTP